MIVSDFAFNEAQKWMFFLTRAIEYKWNTPFTRLEYPTGSGHRCPVVRCSNAGTPMNWSRCPKPDNFDSQTQPPRGTIFDWFSVRDDFFGYRAHQPRLGSAAVIRTPSPGTGWRNPAFRSHLRQLQD